MAAKTILGTALRTSALAFVFVLGACATVEIAPPPPEECAVIAAAAKALDDEGYFAREKRHGAETKLSNLSFPERSKEGGKAPVALDLTQCPGLLDFSRSRGWSVVRPIRYLGQYATGGGVQWFTRPEAADDGTVEVWLGTARPPSWIVTLQKVDGVWVAQEVSLYVRAS